MSVQVLSLASGFLSSTPGTGGAAANPIYTSPTSPALTTIIKSIRLVNTDSVARTVNLYINRVADANNRYITPVNLSVPAGGLVIDDQEITMSSGDKIQYDSTATHIDFLMSGIQR